MEKYLLKKIDKENIKYFSINVGLKPGYISDSEYALENIFELYESWLKKRIQKKLITFPVKITPTYFLYPFKDNTSTIINNESAVEIHGEIINKYCPTIFQDDKELLKIIRTLAEKIARELKQKRIHIILNDEKYILENHE